MRRARTLTAGGHGVASRTRDGSFSPPAGRVCRRSDSWPQLWIPSSRGCLQRAPLGACGWGYSHLPGNGVRGRACPNNSPSTASSSQSKTKQGTPQEPDLGPSSQGRAAAQNVETLSFNPIQNSQSTPREQVNIDGQSTGNPRHQGTPLVEKNARALDLEAHQLGESGREFERPQIGSGIAEALAIVARQVDSAN